MCCYQLEDFSPELQKAIGELLVFLKTDGSSMMEFYRGWLCAKGIPSKETGHACHYVFEEYKKMFTR